MLYKDCIGRDVSVDDFVLRDGVVYQIVKLNPKMISGDQVAPRAPKNGVWVKKGMKTQVPFYAMECALLPKEDVLMWIIMSGFNVP